MLHPYFFMVGIPYLGCHAGQLFLVGLAVVGHQFARLRGPRFFRRFRHLSGEKHIKGALKKHQFANGNCYCIVWMVWADLMNQKVPIWAMNRWVGLKNVGEKRKVSSLSYCWKTEPVFGHSPLLGEGKSHEITFRYWQVKNSMFMGSSHMFIQGFPMNFAWKPPFVQPPFVPCDVPALASP